jgi:hypothetical protein
MVRNGVQNPDFGVFNSEFGLRNSGAGVRNPDFGAFYSVFVLLKSAAGVFNSNFGVRNPEAEPFYSGNGVWKYLFVLKKVFTDTGGLRSIKNTVVPFSNKGPG